MQSIDAPGSGVSERSTFGRVITVRLDDVLPTAWRNGGGVTRELLVVPATGEWSARVSVADIGADGPFSAYPGVRRWTTVLDGAGIELTIDGTKRRLDADGACLAFDGAANVDARLSNGPVRDLNLMARGAPGSLAAVRPAVEWVTTEGRGGVFAWTAGRLWTSDADRPRGVGARTLVWFDVLPATLRFEPIEGASEACRAWWLWAGVQEGGTT